MKQIITFIFILLCYFQYAEASEFHLGKIIQDEKKLEMFLSENLSTSDVKSAQDLKESWGRENKIFQTPIVAEFSFALINSPKAIVEFLKIFLDKSKFIFFSLGIILSLILGHYMGELKFYFKALSWQRTSYSLFRFFTINGFRVWLFAFLFGANLKPMVTVYLTAVKNVESTQPFVFKASQIFNFIV